jgi:hypothetical protein
MQATSPLPINSRPFLKADEREREKEGDIKRCEGVNQSEEEGKRAK